MVERLILEVITPEKAVVSEEVEMVVVPGTEGEFGVLKGHTTFLTFLKSGILRFKTVSGAEKKYQVEGGFAEVLPDKMTVLAASAVEA